MDEKQLYSCITWQLLFLYPGQQRTKYCLLINLCYIIFNQIWVPKLILFTLHSHNLNSTDHRHRIDTLIANQTARTALPPTTAKSGNRKMADCPSLFLPNQSQRIAFSTLTLLAGRQEGHPACKKTEWWRGAGVVICLELGADLHMAELMPLPLTVSCFSKIQTGFTFLVPAHPGSPGKRAIKRVCVCVCA